MAQQRRRSEFRTSLEWSYHRSLLHPSRLYNCYSPRIRVLGHRNRAPHQAESTNQQKRHPYKALIKDSTPSQRTRMSPVEACLAKFYRLLLDSSASTRRNERSCCVVVKTPSPNKSANGIRYVENSIDNSSIPSGDRRSHRARPRTCLPKRKACEFFSIREYSIQ